MSGRTYRVGQIVPSSNTTMETEIPAMLRAREGIRPERFTFHSSRMRLKKVTREELAAMDAESDRCAIELSDAHVDVLGYACLVATMSMGHGYHRKSQDRLHGRTVENGAPAPVVTSAGALIEGLGILGAKKVAMMTPYMKPLTKMVAEYIEAEGFTVLDRVSLEIEDNIGVGRHDPNNLVPLAKAIDLSEADALILAACVQLPSLPVLQAVEDAVGKPVISASVCTTYRILEELGLEAVVPNAGALLSGAYNRTPQQLRAAS